MAYESKHPLFKSLDDEQEKVFRQWARDNFKPDDKIDSAWHPVIRDECLKIQDELTKEEVEQIRTYVRSVGLEF